METTQQREAAGERLAQVAFAARAKEATNAALAAAATLAALTGQAHVVVGASNTDQAGVRRWDTVTVPDGQPVSVGQMTAEDLRAADAMGRVVVKNYREPAKPHLSQSVDPSTVALVYQAIVGMEPSP